MFWIRQSHSKFWQLKKQRWHKQIRSIFHLQFCCHLHNYQLPLQQAIQLGGQMQLCKVLQQVHIHTREKGYCQAKKCGNKSRMPITIESHLFISCNNPLFKKKALHVTFPNTTPLRVKIECGKIQVCWRKVYPGEVYRQHCVLPTPDLIAQIHVNWSTTFLWMIGCKIRRKLPS